MWTLLKKKDWSGAEERCKEDTTEGSSIGKNKSPDEGIRGMTPKVKTQLRVLVKLIKKEVLENRIITRTLTLLIQ